jgi:hypothetical protein
MTDLCPAELTLLPLAPSLDCADQISQTTGKRVKIKATMPIPLTAAESLFYA